MNVIIRIFVAELLRNFRRMWSYRIDTLGQITLWLLAFPFLMTLFVGVSPSFGPEEKTASLIGFVVWNLFMITLSNVTDEITRDANEGVLESVMLTPVAPVTIFSLRVVASLIIQSSHTVLIGMVLLFLYWFPIRSDSVLFLILGLTFATVLGAALALGGFALVYKQTSSIVSVASLLALLMTGALIPLNELGWAYDVLVWAIPTTWGIDVLRSVMLGSATWNSLWLNGTLLGMLVQSIGFLVAGSLVFNWGFRRAQEQGSLASY
jgi:ABC-2 type transport system permease protein